MPNPIFHVKCKLDGVDAVLAVQTHGNRSVTPDVPIVRTREQAVAHVRKLAETHRIEDESGVRYVHHIDGAGDEHTITDICKPEEVQIAEPGNSPRARAAGTPAEIAEIAGAPDGAANRSRKPRP
jgi:hypothetical protein